jgi:hypothetical protein
MPMACVSSSRTEEKWGWQTARFFAVRLTDFGSSPFESRVGLTRLVLAATVIRLLITLTNMGFGVSSYNALRQMSRKTLIKAFDDL